MAERPAGAPQDAEFLAFHVARTPTAANLVRAQLEGAGIPAHVEGQMLTDEIAVSRTLMNLQSVRVFVRRADVERAREVLANTAIDEDELERQALAAAPVETIGDPAARPSGTSWTWIVATAVLGVSTVLFFSLWMDERTANSDPLFAWEPMPNGIASRWRATGSFASQHVDEDRNGIYETIRVYDRGGRLGATLFDANENGIRERWVEELAGDLKLVVLDADEDGRPDRWRIERPDGTVVRELVFAGEQGFVDAPR